MLRSDDNIAKQVLVLEHQKTTEEERTGLRYRTAGGRQWAVACTVLGSFQMDLKRQE